MFFGRAALRYPVGVGTKSGRQHPSANQLNELTLARISAITSSESEITLSAPERANQSDIALQRGVYFFVCINLEFLYNFCASSVLIKTISTRIILTSNYPLKQGRSIYSFLRQAK
jgi:hypothetical protein